MSLVTIISELIRFLKDYALKIILSALLIGLAVASARYYFGGFETPEMEAAYQDLKQRYEQEPAEFQIILTNAEGAFFSNSFLIDEYFGQPEVVEKIEKETGIEFAGWVESENILELIKTSQFRGAMAALRDGSTELITVRVAVGKSAEENLQIAQAYQNFIVEETLPFLESYKVSLVNKAEIGEQLSELKFSNLATTETLEHYNRISTRSAIVFGVAGAIGGAVLTALALFLLRLFKSKIGYAFDYSWAMEDRHYIFNRTNTEHEADVVAFMSIPKRDHRYVVIQGDPEKLLPVEDQKDLIFVTKVQDIQDDVEEIIFVIYANQTDKAWYNEQYHMAKLYDVPVKIMQLM